MCRSPALLEKPLDWGNNIDVVGFSTLPSPSDYQPPSDLQNFLNAGPAPIYIGFGSIVVDDAAALTRIVFDAVQATGQRAVVSKGWGNIGAEETDTESIMMIDKCPHDWLFQHVSAVIHHGGAGTTAAGLALGRPTVVVPFFGDQTFWGSIVSRAGAGPNPIPWKRLTAEKLADAIRFALRESTKEKAAEIGENMRQEEGVRNAVCSFYGHIDEEALRCALCPSRPAVWWVTHSHIKLSAFAATVLVETGLLKPHNLVLYRSKEYDTSRDPRGPLSAGAEVLYGVVTDFVATMASVPTDVAEAFRGNGHRHRSKRHLRHGQKNRPIHAWKKERYAQGRTNMGVSKKSDAETETEGGSEGESAGSDTSPSSSSASSYRSAREGQETSSSSVSKSRTNGAVSNAERDRDVDAMASADVDVFSKIPTNEDAADDMKALSLENTIGRHQSREKAVEVREVLTDARYHVSRAGKHLLEWVLLLPTDLTMSFSKGFHNAPKLYHDPMVQETPTVRGARGGLRAAGTVGLYLYPALQKRC